MKKLTRKKCQMDWYVSNAAWHSSVHSHKRNGCKPENDVFVPPDIPSNEFSKIINKESPINKYINNKRRKAITDIEFVSDTDNDY
jgi:hypothetical protein